MSESNIITTREGLKLALVAECESIVSTVESAIANGVCDRADLPRDIDALYRLSLLFKSYKAPAMDATSTLSEPTTAG